MGLSSKIDRIKKIKNKLATIKGWHTEYEMLWLLGNNESLFKFALENKYIRVVTKVSFGRDRYYVNFKK